MVDKHIKEIEKKVFSTPKEGEVFMDNYLKEVFCNPHLQGGGELFTVQHYIYIFQNSIIRKKKQGKSSLEGNQCREFLKKLDKLEQAFFLAGFEEAVNGRPFIASMRSFSRVVDLCFQVELKEGYQESIKEFERKYLELGVTVTPKVRLHFNKILSKI